MNMKDLRLWANYYYNMGFNITHINAKQNQKAKNPYKSATTDRFVIQNRRQELSEMQNFDWEKLFKCILFGIFKTCKERKHTHQN
jgi:hypothetical protein